ncbi:glycosyltransferase [Terrabacter sp. NPDC000476]|uniref:glycosyltransferase n=1 Tax=Terrabacter sp. NPDC000476 TaxID=3154258 RepID=UPI003322ACAD
MGSPAPLLTVICNVHDDPDRLPRAVASALAAWEGPGIEVLVVDDGSTDDTGAVADRLAAADERVRVLHRGSNDGAPGAPRNLGLDDARGEWVAFVDSDDEYLPGTLRRLVDRAVDADADVAAGAVARYNERTDRVTPLPATAYTSGPVGPLAPGSPLWLDTIAVAKVLRRSLLDELRIRFPERILYEDQPFTVAVWSAARRVATLDEVVYHWYVNNVAGEESITARRHEIDNFHDRVAANRAIDDQLVGRPDLAAAKLDKFVRHDLALYAKDLDAREPAYRTAFLAAASDYLAGVPAELRAGLEQPYRLVVRELVDGTPESALAACLFAFRSHHVDRPLVRRSGGWWWPHRPAAGSTADHDLTALVEQLHTQGRRVRTTRCTALSGDGARLRLRGSVVDGDDTLGASPRVTVVVVDRATASPVATASAAVGRDGAFEVELDLPASGLPPADVTWDLKAGYASGLRRFVARRPGPLRPIEAPPADELADGPATVPGAGVETYRTRNGNLSLRSVGTGG